MQSSSSRSGALVSLVGGIFILLGFVLPMFFVSNAQIPRGNYYYEWQLVYGLLYRLVGPAFFVLLAIVVALPLLEALIIIATSLATLFGRPFTRLAWVKFPAATLGFTLQFFFTLFMYIISHIGIYLTISWGFTVVPLGFLVALIGIFIIEPFSGNGQGSGRTDMVMRLIRVVLMPLVIFVLLVAMDGFSGISWGLWVMLLGFVVIAIGTFVDLSSFPRAGAFVTLAGVALALVGLFLPIFTRMYPIYEWQIVQASTDLSNIGQGIHNPAAVGQILLFDILAALPLLGLFVPLITSVATLFQRSLPQPLWLKQAAVAWSLAAQLLFDVFVIMSVGGGSSSSMRFIPQLLILAFILSLIVAIFIGRAPNSLKTSNHVA